MAYKAKLDFLWYKQGQSVQDDLVKKNKWYNLVEEFDVVKPKESTTKKNILDLNNDGKVDRKDLKLAGKALRNIGRKIRKK